MKKFADLEEQLKQQEADHKDTIYNLERKAVVDKDRFYIYLFFYFLISKKTFKIHN